MSSHTTLFVTVFVEITNPIFCLYGNKSKTAAGRYFGLAGIYQRLQAGFQALRGERVKMLLKVCKCQRCVMSFCDRRAAVNSWHATDEQHIWLCVSMWTFCRFIRFHFLLISTHTCDHV